MDEVAEYLAEDGLPKKVADVRLCCFFLWGTNVGTESFVSTLEIRRAVGGVTHSV